MGRKLLKNVDKQNYEVDCKSRNVTYIPRNKDEKKQLLKNLVFLKLSERWMKIPSNIATLERQTFKELIESF